jgi:hypothetical protein
LHIIWTTYNSWQPQDARGDWSALRELYKQLNVSGHYYELSAALPESVPLLGHSNAVALTLHEQSEVENYLSKLMASEGDRIAGNLPVTCCAVHSSFVQLLFVPALSSHSQIIGRLKSKTASQVLWSPQRKGQKHIWAGGYWLANINGAEAIAKVEQFINEQRSK